jgi:hypothetical protein
MSVILNAPSQHIRDEWTQLFKNLIALDIERRERTRSSTAFTNTLQKSADQDQLALQEKLLVKKRLVVNVEGVRAVKACPANILCCFGLQEFEFTITSGIVVGPSSLSLPAALYARTRDVLSSARPCRVCESMAVPIGCLALPCLALPPCLTALPYRLALPPCLTALPYRLALPPRLASPRLACRSDTISLTDGTDRATVSALSGRFYAGAFLGDIAVRSRVRSMRTN